MSYTYEYPRPSVTVDAVVFGFLPEGGELQVLLIERAEPPYKGLHALPGGFVNVSDGPGQGEDLEVAARRELVEETSVRVEYLEQLRTFGEPGRDPRGRVISVAYMALVRSADHVATAGSDAARASWVSVPRAMNHRLAFDHGLILKAAVDRLRAKVRYAPVGFALLPKRFTMPELRGLYERILGKSLDPGNFRKAMLRMGALRKVGNRSPERLGRPSDLYEFDKRAYDRATREGIGFDPVPMQKSARSPETKRLKRSRRS